MAKALSEASSSSYLRVRARFLLSRKTLSSVFRHDTKPIGVGIVVAASHSRGLHAFTLPDLAYGYGAVEPAISGKIMQLHHQKHHQTYITNYNKALEQLHDAIARADSSSFVKLQSTIKFNGGEYTAKHSVESLRLRPTSHVALV
ncbi:hypothetical protein RJT34_12517 [Clitoria ternatea]|uniref:superoxide dismutase n=1 Tax=Clitoria ternatea TaxID=43366 RepID=A0AAN9JM63_CLITE